MCDLEYLEITIEDTVKDEININSRITDVTKTYFVLSNSFLRKKKFPVVRI